MPIEGNFGPVHEDALPHGPIEKEVGASQTALAAILGKNEPIDRIAEDG